MACRKAKKPKDQEDRLVCVHYDSEGELCDEEGRNVDLQSHKYANKCVMLTAKPKKTKKRNYRDIEFDESIYEEALARKKRALLRKHIFTSKELATLALLNSDSEEESGDENLISNPLKPASTSNHQYPRPLSPAVSVVSNDDSSSEISVTRLSPAPIDMPVTEGTLARLEGRMDTLESKLDRIMELMENKASENEQQDVPTLVSVSMAGPSTTNKQESMAVPLAPPAPSTPNKVLNPPATPGSSTPSKGRKCLKLKKSCPTPPQPQQRSGPIRGGMTIPKIPTVSAFMKQDYPDSDYITEAGVNLLKVPGKDPIKYAIALMHELFTEEEMAKSCYVGTRSKKPSLPLDKRELLEECIDKRFGYGTVEACWDTLKQRCNQKCCNIGQKLKARQRNLSVYDFDDFN